MTKNGKLSKRDIQTLDKDIYAEVHQKRAERCARRQERYEREARRERVLGPVRYGLQVILGAAMFYLYLFAACLWAAA